MNWPELANTKLVKYLNTHQLSKGIGTEESACSIAAINLALTGELHDEVPECMSAVVGEWIIRVQDSMPAKLRNSKKWKSLLPLAAGTGREKEIERLDLINNWTWETVLPKLTPIVKEHANSANDFDFFSKWEIMLKRKTSIASYVLYNYAIGKGEFKYIVDSHRIFAHAIADIVRPLRIENSGDALGAVVVNASKMSVYDYWEKIDCYGLFEKLVAL